VVIGALDIEPDVPIRADPAQEEADASQFPDRCSYSMHHWSIVEWAFCRIELVRGVATTVQVKVHAGPAISAAFRAVHADLAGVNQQSFGRVESEALDVEMLHVMSEAVVLSGVDGVELIDLHEVQAGHVGLFRRIDARLFEGPPDLGVSHSQTAADDEVLDAPVGREDRRRLCWTHSINASPPACPAGKFHDDCGIFPRVHRAPRKMKPERPSLPQVS
jgi:hypothetical protein